MYTYYIIHIKRYKMFKKLLLAVDGSYNASQAAKLAGSLARELEADLWIVTAFDPVPPYLSEPNMQNAINARMEAAEAVLKETLKAVGTIHGGLKT